MKCHRVAPTLPLLALLLVLPDGAFAHTGGGGAGFLTGFLHPLGGLDHVLAMLAVGMWGAQLGNPAIWGLPVALSLKLIVPVRFTPRGESTLVKRTRTVQD